MLLLRPELVRENKGRGKGLSKKADLKDFLRNAATWSRGRRGWRGGAGKTGQVINFTGADPVNKSVEGKRGGVRGGGGLRGPARKQVWVSEGEKDGKGRAEG